MRLSDELDGNGGGFGKFPGLTVKDLESKFGLLIKDGSHRSVTAILRLTREQLMTRADLGLNQRLVLVAGGLLVVTGIAFLLVPDSFKPVLKTAVFASGVAFCALLAGVIFNRKATRRSMAQVEAIRQLACDSLLSVVTQHGFVPKPLDEEQRRFLKALLRQSRRTDPALVLLFG